MSEIPMIYAALTQAAASINAVGKNGVNQQQGWKFRGIDDVYNALNPALIAAGITIVPQVADMSITQDAPQQNGRQGATTARLTMRYTVYAQDGSHVEAVTVGEGKDYGDKACNKAMAIAYKYMAFQLFCIPTEEMRLADPDLYVPDEIAAKTAQISPDNHGGTNPRPLRERAESAEKAPAVVKKSDKVERKPRQQVLTELSVVLHSDIKGVQSAWKALRDAGIIPNKPTKELTDEEFDESVKAFVANFGVTE